MAFFGKKNQDDRRFVIYTPEPKNTDPFSKWRRPSHAYLNSSRAKTQELNILKSLIKFLNLLNVILALSLFAGLIIFVFFTDFERVVFDDGTYLSCIVEPDGTITNQY